MTSLARFLSWLPGLRPVLSRRMILDGALGQACLNDLRPARSIYAEPYLAVGPHAAWVIIQAYQAGRLPMKEGAKIGKTGRAEVYARSPLREPGQGGEGEAERG